MSPPKKYVKIAGVTKLNPEWKRWKESQSGKPATTVPFPNEALPVISSMQDHEVLCTVNGDTPLAESTDATLEIMQEPDIALEAGMKPDEIVDEIGAILNKYEVPMGLMNKLMILSEFDVIEFMVDDSGSMSMVSDTVNEKGRPQTRWQEAHSRLKQMIEILAYVPFQSIHVLFLNRKTVVQLARNGRDPKSFLVDAYSKIDIAFKSGPTGATPFLERIRESLTQGRGKNVCRYFFGDGTPNGGLPAKEQIVQLLKHRANPQMNPITFLSCTNEDAQVEWMKDAEEIVPYCAECDDFRDETEEVLRDQGAALPFTYGFYLICCLVAPMNPGDLDAMDESVPFTKATLDNLLGIQHNDESYRHYFNHFLKAQRSRSIDLDDYGRPKKSDELKKNANWESVYQDFSRAPVADQIPAVIAFKRALVQ